MGKTKEEARVLLIKVSLLILMGASGLMTVINCSAADKRMMYSSLALFLGFSFCLFVAQVLKKVEWAVILFTVIVDVLFTWYFFIGGSEGISCLWLLVFPYAVMTIVGLKYGLVASGYFQILLLVFCLTPAKQYLLFDYSETFLTRFPILYFFSMITAIWTSFQLEKAARERKTTIGRLNEAVAEERKRNVELAMQTIISISHAVDAKDPYTNEHSLRVAEYSRMIATQLGWNEEELQNIYVASLIHDIGKIGVPDAVLNKPGKLTDEEYDLIKQHPEIGHGIMKDFDAIVGAADGILYHHERYDGRGYPHKLKGEEIPVFGRIIAVADSFDAMNSNRVYRGALDKEYIIGQLEQGKGTQFDPQFADIMLRLIAEGKVSFER